MSEIGLNIAALIIIIIFSVKFTQAIGGFGTLFLNKGFKIGSCKYQGLCQNITIPPLLGMLLLGGLARNTINEVVGELDPEWSLNIRRIALTTILLRAGLGLDLKKLRQNSSALIRLTALPQIFEATGAAVTANLLLGFPWPLCFALGFMMGAVSPAVVVPSCINLRNQGYGVEKGIPSIVIAASSLDDVLAISLFGLFLGISFGGESGENHISIIDDHLINSIVIGPIEIIGGIILGAIIGLVLRLLDPIKHQFKAVICMIISLTFVFAASFFALSGLGFLATIASASIGAMKWGKEEAEIVEEDIGYFWKFIQVPLFGLIGASIYVPDLVPEIVGLGFVVLLVGLSFRFPVAYISMMNTPMNFKERVFVAIAWMPKATVQAALGGVVLGVAEEVGDDDFIEYGNNILTIAVLCIVVTAPLGAILTALLGPKLLEKNEKPLIELDESIFSHFTIPMVKKEAISPQDLPIARRQVRMEWYKSISAIDFRQVDDALKYENDKYNNEERQLRSSSAPTNPTKEVLDLANRMNYDNLDTVANRDNQGDLS